MTRFLTSAILALLFISYVNADFIQIGTQARSVTAAEISGGAPGGTVYEFFVTTDSDILAIGLVKTRSRRGDFYQHSLGTNNEPPNPAFFTVFPALSADSWITTPGTTSVIGGGFPNNGDDSYFDLTDDGPMNNFKFASLTVPWSNRWLFSGEFILNGSNGMFSHRFQFGSVPEPGSLTLVAGMISGLILRRSNS